MSSGIFLLTVMINSDGLTNCSIAAVVLHLETIVFLRVAVRYAFSDEIRMQEN